MTEEPQLDGDVSTEMTTVADVLRGLGGNACLVGPDADIREIAAAAARSAHIALISVVDEEGVLLGVISRAVLLDELFIYIAPETFLHDLLRKGNIEELGRLTRGQTARNLMSPPAYVYVDDNLGTAFERMHEQRLGGLPVVDRLHHIRGYIDQLQLMLAWLEHHEKAPDEGAQH